MRPSPVTSPYGVRRVRSIAFVFATGAVLALGCGSGSSSDPTPTPSQGGGAGAQADASQEAGGAAGTAGKGGSSDAGGSAGSVVDASTDGPLDGATEAAPDALPDVVPDTAGGCKTDADCAGNPGDPVVCDPGTGKCVHCLPSDPSKCPTGEYCDPASHKCLAGCDSDEDCATGADAGAMTCDKSTYTCVGCMADDQCAPGLLCLGNSCKPGCSAQHACQSGLTCCVGNCVDTSSDPKNCGKCASPCSFPNGIPVCLGGKCALDSCESGYENCDQNGVNGCETPAGDGGACSCAPNEIQNCYTGPDGTEGVGSCKGGTQTCNAAGTAWGPCTGQVLPGQESCYTPADDDCDGETNEGGLGCACVPNSVGACYTGPADTRNVGICVDGTATCNSSGTAWGSCEGQVLPSTETCLTAVDDDCDGTVNETGGIACQCTPNAIASCYSGPPGTEGVGSCEAGAQTCNALGTGYSACEGSVVPAPDVCTDSVDNDCNGVVNDGFLSGADGCVCFPLVMAGCYTGPQGTKDIGVCKGGTAQCDASGSTFGACAGEVTPSPDHCNDSVDNDCNGVVNDGFGQGGAGCVCVPGTEQDCYTGPAGTLGKGVCHAGKATCSADGQSWGPCLGQLIPDIDSCTNMTDDDCNGVVNDGFGKGGEGCVCTPGVVSSCYEGPAGTQNVGPCKAGTATCNTLGTGKSVCTGQVLPIEEICKNGINDNCAGPVDSDCITPCSIAAANRSSVGCTFYAVDTNPIHSFVPGDYAVAISNIDPTTTANVVIETKNGGVWSAISGGTFSVGPLALVNKVLPHRYTSGSTVYTGGAYRITTDLPVIAYQFNPMDGSSSYLSDASLLLPSSAFDNYYIVPAWPYGPADGSMSSGYPAHVQIVAKEATQVKVTSPCETVAGSFPSLVPNVPTTFNLTEGDFLQLTVRDFNDGFNGMYVEADKPVAVFTSNDCANVPSSYCCCEHLEEQVFGLQTWGKQYVAARVTKRSSEPALWQIMAQQDNTVVSFDFKAGVTGLPNQVVLNARQMVQYTVNGPDATNPGDFVVNADKPVLVTQYMVASQMNAGTGDPSQILTVPTAQFLDHYVVLVPSTWVNDYLVLVRPSTATVQIDGVAVTSGWANVGSSPYQAARVAVSDGVHKLQGTAPFGVIVLGYDSYDSYGYPGGLDQKIINPIE